MRIKHQFKDQNAEREVEDTAQLGFFMSNKAGGLLFFDARKDKTQYYALVKGRVIKVIHDINAATKVAGINHKFHSIEITRQGEEHELFVPHYMNALLINSRSEEPIQLVLELKDMQKHGNREHSLSQKQGRIVIRSDQSGTEEGAVYTAIQGENIQYDYNKQLNKENGHSQIVLDIFAPKISVGVSHDENDAVMLANHLFLNEQKIKDIQESYLSISKRFKDPEAALAYACALNSTDHMFIHDTTKEAGTVTSPFFSSAKSPHTSIAMHALLLEGEFRIAKRALLSELQLQHQLLIEGKGRFEEVAWPLLLFGKLLNNICAKGKLYTYFTADELKDAAVKIAQIVSMVHEKKEMRPGLEPQVLMLSMYDLAYALTKSESYIDAEKSLRRKAAESIREMLSGAKSRGNVLREDAEAVFLAAYIYPILMGKDEWKCCFNTLLDVMHNTFGIFQNKTVREGGSRSLKLELFGLKSLAAIVFSSLDPEHYEKHINEILRTSISEVLYKGIIGRPTSSFDDGADPEKEALVEDAHLLNNALFLEMLRGCA
jgi:hypothetical protein